MRRSERSAPTEKEHAEKHAERAAHLSDPLLEHGTAQGMHADLFTRPEVIGNITIPISGVSEDRTNIGPDGGVRKMGRREAPLVAHDGLAHHQIRNT